MLITRPSGCGAATTARPFDDAEFPSGLMAWDMVEAMLPRLSEMQQRILLLLLSDRGVRDVARQLGITHPAVIKHRRKIARVARGLFNEVTPIRHRTAAA
jgi:hypothetical protein